MNIPYEPSMTISAKINRKILPYRAQRTLRFSLTRPVVSFTFDDFPKSAIENGARLLEDQDWRASFYVSSGLMDTKNHHGKHFSAQDIKDLVNTGHEIAGHSYSHVDCEQLGISHVLDEIEKNHCALKAMGVSSDIQHFAYPFGAASAELKRALQTRFKTLRGIRPGVHRHKVDLNGLLSTPIFSGPKLNEALEFINGLAKNPGWLTLFTHDIRTSPSKWGCTPQEFKAVIKAVKNSGALVLPIGGALNYLEGCNE